MFKNYLAASWRNLRRNRIFSVINIAGLAVGLAVFFLLYQYILFERSYDQFHTNAPNVYRVAAEYIRSNTTSPIAATIHPAIAPALKAEFPEVKEFTRVVRATLFTNTLTLSLETPQGAKTFNENYGFFADEGFFKVFSFPMVEGSPATALKEPGSIVITQSTARRYFGNEPALGRELTFNGQIALKITGVMKDVPANSHLQFDMLIAFNTLGTNFGHDNWGWPEFYNYTLLHPQADPAAVNAKLHNFVEKHMAERMRAYNMEVRLLLQPLTCIHLNADPRYDQASGAERTLQFLMLLAIFILVIAWINYINLTTAHSLERAKEVGLRKVVGANKEQLVVQFLLDAFIVNTVAVCIAALIVSVSLGGMEFITGKNIEGFIYTEGLWNAPSFWIIFPAVFITSVLIAGAYPAMVLASYKPVAVLKGKFYRSTTGNTVRKSLVSFQYAVTIVLIAGTVLIYQQLTFMNETDAGYAKDEILVVKAPSVYDSTVASTMKLLKNELNSFPAIQDVSISLDIPGHPIGDHNTVRRADQETNEGFNTFLVGVDEDYFRTYGVPTLAGRAFREGERMSPVFGPHEGPRNPVKVLVNEEAAHRLGYLNPEDILQREIIFAYGMGEHRAEVIGVVKNYHQTSLKEKYKSILYFYPGDDSWTYISLRIDTQKPAQTLDMVKSSYAKLFPGSAFEYFFLDDHFDSQYKADRQFAAVFGTFTVIAIMIACLGLLGLSIFNANQRVKEIGIRKVLGATFANIMLLFSKDLVRILLLAYLITIPIVYVAGKYWLESFAFHIPMGWAVFAIPPSLLLFISLATVFAVCLRTVLLNPAVSLRQE